MADMRLSLPYAHVRRQEALQHSMNVTFRLVLPVFLILSYFQILSRNFFVHGDLADRLVQDNVSSNFSKLYIECIKETQVNPKLVLELISGNIIQNPNHTLKKWVMCILVKKNIMSPQGVFQMDEALAHVHFCRQNSVEELIDKCIPKIENSNKPHLKLPHEIAWAYITCFNRESPSWRFI